MTTLLERLRAARECWVEVEGHEFLIRRPTELQALRWKDDEEFLRYAVVAWRKIKELDVVPGGSGSEPAFEIDAFIEWAMDRPKIWAGVCKAINETMKKHRKDREEAEKK